LLLVTTRNARGLETIAAGTVGAIDPRTNRIVAQIRVGGRPSRLAVAGDRLWVLNAGDGTISEIDGRADREVANFGPNVVPADLAADGRSVWVGAAAHGTPSRVARFDARRHTAISVTALPGGRLPSTSRPASDRYVVEGGGRIFAIGPTLQPVAISARTGRVTRTFATQVTSLAYGDGALWGVARRSVVRIDPTTGQTNEFPVSSLFDLSGIAFGGGFVWATSPFEGVVWRIDPRPPGQRISIPLAFGASVIAFGAGSAWVGNTYDDSISRIDPTTRNVTRVATVPAPQDIVVGAHRVWVASGSTAGRSGPLVSSACGAVQSGGKPPEVLIASDFALQGGEGPNTAAAVATIDRTLADRGYRAGRFRVGYQSCDDSTPSAGGSDDGQCVANAASYAVDSSVVAVIGPSDSPCALDEIPVANRAPRAPLPMVSPFATGAFLTRHGLPGAAQTLAQFYAGGPRNFFRTIGADHIQVAADATFAQRLGLHRVGVVFNERGMIQAAEERWFAYAASRLRGIRAVPILWNGDQRILAAKVRRAGVNGVFLVAYAAASPPEAAATLKTLGEALPGKPVIVTDAFSPWALAAGSRAKIYASMAGLFLPSQLTAPARRLLAALPRADRIPFAVSQAFSGVSALVDAVARSDGSRRSILEQLRRNPTFDRWGDPRTAPVSIFRVGGEAVVPTLGRGRLVATITPATGVVPPG
jgi:DNA-binding beta-propeller fold protein YncE/ABC-type branched-subunit amino acid transport system substrate-binding protein